MPRKFKRPINYHGRIISRVESEQVVEDIATLIGVPCGVLRSYERSGSVIKSRRISSWVLRGVLRLSFTEVGYLLNKHHTSIIHACQCWEKAMDVDPSARADTARLMWAVWRAHRARLAGRVERAKVGVFSTLQYRAGKRTSQERLARKQREIERISTAASSEISWSDKDWSGTPSSFFKKQNDRFVAHARRMLALEQKEYRELNK